MTATVQTQIARIYNEEVMPLFFKNRYRLDIVNTQVMNRHADLRACLYFQELPSHSSVALLLMDSASGMCASSVTLTPRGRDPAVIEIASQTVSVYRRQGLHTFLRMLSILLVSSLFPHARFLISDAESPISQRLNRRLGFVPLASAGPFVSYLPLTQGVVHRTIEALADRFPSRS